MTARCIRGDWQGPSNEMVTAEHGGLPLCPVCHSPCVYATNPSGTVHPANERSAMTRLEMTGVVVAAAVVVAGLYLWVRLVAWFAVEVWPG